MKEYLKEMLSNGDEASHKRFIAIASFIVLIGMVIAKFFGAQLSIELIYVFAALTGGQSVMTVIEKFTNKQ